MKTLVWVVLGFLLVSVATAVSARVGAGHVLPEFAVIVAVFLAFRRDPIAVTGASLMLGYLVGRQALAPAGLHELSLALVAVGVYMVAGNLVGSGVLFFALSCGAATLAYHVTLFSVMYLWGGHTGFSSWWTASLLPAALLTGVFAALFYPGMQALDALLIEDKREGLQWR